MDFERLRHRAQTIRKIREFFWHRDYLEADTPALSPTLIPETCLEVFRTELLSPGNGIKTPLYLVPSPEVFLKPLIAKHRCNVFQISKCYRNGESSGHIHSPEFTMLEYYTMDADYQKSIGITEALFAHLGCASPFFRLPMDEAFRRFAGFSLDAKQDAAQLAAEARRLGIDEQAPSAFSSWSWADLYELIFVHCVEPALESIEGPVVLMDYPAQVPCLAQDGRAAEGEAAKTKERWELYVQGMELANCYSEETCPERVKDYFEREGALKTRGAQVPHEIDENYWRHFHTFPRCSGVALGVDRLEALLCGMKSIEGVLP